MLYRRHFNVQPLHEHICGSFDAYIFQVNATGEIIFQLYIRSNNGRLWMSLGGLKKLIEGLEEVHQTVLENEAHVLEFRRNADDVLYEEKFVDEVRNRLITFKLVVSYGKHPFPNTAGDMILDITTENLKDPSKGSFIPLGIFPGSNAILNLKNNLEELLKAHEDRQWELRAHKEEQNRVE
uniref:Uncharacterized protein n=1 Tax=Acrobeloides nanus TaxID=290746 RepID=A0A914DYE7_9BILA